MKVQSRNSNYQSILGENVESTTVGYLWIQKPGNVDYLVWEYANGSAHTNSFMQTFFTGYDDVWVHFAVVADYSGTYPIKFYRNGELIQTGVMSGTPVFPSTNRAKYLGVGGNNQAKLINGNLDDIRIYNRELTASEIKAIYEGTK